MSTSSRIIYECDKRDEFVPTSNIPNKYLVTRIVFPRQKTCMIKIHVQTIGSMKATGRGGYWEGTFTYFIAPLSGVQEITFPTESNWKPQAGFAPLSAIVPEVTKDCILLQQEYNNESCDKYHWVITASAIDL